MQTDNESCHSLKRDHLQAFGESCSELHVLQDKLGSRSESMPPEIPYRESHNATTAVKESTETCCFGTLDKIAIQFRTDQDTPLSQLTMATRTSISGNTYLILQVNYEQGQGQAQDSKGSCIAMLNSDVAKRLSHLLTFTSLRLEGVLPRSALESAFGSTQQISAGFVTSIGLNVYGAPAIATSVASHLSQNNLYLQDPKPALQDVVYDNPQSLRFPEHILCTMITNMPALSSPDDHGIGEHLRLNCDLGTKISMQDGNTREDLLPSTLIDCFAQHDYLTGASVDPTVVRTSLLPYQEKGLEFLLNRESAVSEMSRSLWEHVKLTNLDDGSEKHIYQHRITGNRRDAAEDVNGGILADEMGLGKSLMMISAILATRTSSAEFAWKSTQLPSMDKKAVTAAKSTVIIVPSVLLVDTWIEEIKKHTITHALTWFVFHGPNRSSRPLYELLHHNIILTTYGTVVAEHRRREQSLLFSTRWYRIVLDEAHVIRNRTTVQYRAVSRLSSHIRWCLTGTPIQNSLTDLGSLVSFLRIPFLEDPILFRRKILHQATAARGNRLKDPALFRRKITHQASVARGAHQLDFHNLQLLLRSICLRRTKTVLSLSQSTEHTYQLHLTDDETRGYKAVVERCKETISLAIGGHEPKAAHQTVLQALLRMRRYCNHTDFVVERSIGFNGGAEELGSILEQEDATVCHDCSCDVMAFANTPDIDCGIITPCRQVICSDCVGKYTQRLQNSDPCPFCQMRHAFSSDMPYTTTASSVRNRKLPSKIKTLCQDLENHRSESKSVVFSFWKNSLDIIGLALSEAQIPYVRVDGSMRSQHRRTVLSQFAEAPQGMVLLMTFNTGAVGLNNLSVANRVHILEPQWNPFVERQAVGRIARLGQTQTVHIIRYIVENTVETLVQDGQLQKLRLATSSFGKESAADLERKTQAITDLICPL